ncbi:Sodium channel protein type 11 subunit alpha [Lentibacillus sp. JNUCC-1]|uniref:ion transporter n=1 Tax=Lentibacillus sp. JNUCC-1 TaxID=2654513 RepID=UPI0012E80B09|nr:ion transporter [Lentibacillus sp. JNUCC-1]MUV37566.1 Sodium channel protein type 11 subunit alpha [Lentibacillus sp. JNUCC-1]
MKQIKMTCRTISEHPVFMNVIIGLILVNAVLVGLETYESVAVKYGSLIYIVDQALLWIFTIEIIIRLIGSTSLKAFFTDPWSLFDFVIVASGHILVGAYYVTVLRILRVLRVLRAISIVPSLRRMVNALLLTIPSMGTILLLLSLFFYIYGVIGTMLFKDVAPEYFGSLHSSLLTLFQVVTLESWASGVMRPILALDPSSWWFFVTFILIGTFVIFNLFVGVVVNNVEEANAEENLSPTEVKLAEVQKELEEIKQLLKEK